MLRIVFMGTPDFAVPSLSVCHREHQVLTVVTQPDKAKGRGHKMSYSPVKDFAMAHGIPVLQPKRASQGDFVSALTELRPDIMVVVAFGQKIPTSLLTLAPHGCINVHGSLLPQYRGSSPIHRAIADGLEMTGVTTMYLSEEWDAGDIILQRQIPITTQDTAGSMHDRMMDIGAELLGETLQMIEAGTAPRVPQNDDEATYAYKLSKDDGRINWNLTAKEIESFIRGMTPWPGAFTEFKGDTLKVRKASVLFGTNTPGQVTAIDEWGIVVGTGQGLLRLEEVQRPGAKWLSGRDAANGMRLQTGEEFRTS